MKTAISVPDATFRAVDERAKQLGMSRSEFFSRAADHFLDDLDGRSLTMRINAALEAGEDRETEAAVVEAGRMTLLSDDEDW